MFETSHICTFMVFKKVSSDYYLYFTPVFPFFYIRIYKLYFIQENFMYQIYLIKKDKLGLLLLTYAAVLFYNLLPTVTSS